VVGGFPTLRNDDSDRIEEKWNKTSSSEGVMNPSQGDLGCKKVWAVGAWGDRGRSLEKSFHFAVNGRKNTVMKG